MTGKKSPGASFEDTPTSTTMATGALIERMRINADGNVSIVADGGNEATDSTNKTNQILILETKYNHDWNNPNPHIGGTGITFKISDDNNSHYGEINYIGRGVTGEGDSMEDDGALQFKVSNNSKDSGGGTTEAMRIDYNGNLGIGTDSPVGKLDVRGQISCQNGINIDPDNNNILINTARHINYQDNWTPVQITYSHQGSYGGNLFFNTHFLMIR